MSVAYDRDPIYGQPRRRRTWTDVLGEFEAELDRAEALLRDEDPDAVMAGVGLWEAPTGLGALPAEHLEWAQRIHERQRHLIESLQQAVSKKHQQRVYAAAVDPRPSSRPSIYIDAHA